MRYLVELGKQTFQSTPLMRGETAVVGIEPKTFLFQSTPLMRGETLWSIQIAGCSKISIHSPHARGDADYLYPDSKHPISIHSPHARGDPE